MMLGTVSSGNQIPTLKRSHSTSSLRRKSAHNHRTHKHHGDDASFKNASQPKERLRKRLSISSLPATSVKQKPLSLWDYLKLELTVHNDTAFTNENTEQLMNVIKTPLHLEKVISFGVLTCFDSFLYTFTILPIRLVYALYKVIQGRGRALSSTRRGDIAKGVIFFIVVYGLLNVDTSRIYHGIRGQAAMKLYVMFNVLEIADKLCAAIGQDIMECLYSSNTLDKPQRFLLFSSLAIVYCSVHSYILLYQVLTLNVAVNSYSNALLTLLLSNQFSEIKSAVFKKFERENLFQLTCADITERFQLLAMLIVIGVRNVIEVSSTGVVPNSWQGWNRWFGALFGPAFVVVGSEVVVDWLKHAYIVKFNNMRPKVFRKFLDVLTLDYAENAFSDQIMTKRLGLPVYPLGCVFVRMLIQCYTIFVENSTSEPVLASKSSKLTSAASASAISAINKVDIYLRAKFVSPELFNLKFFLVLGISFLLLLVCKLVLGSSLRSYALRRYASTKRRYQANRKQNDEKPDFLSTREKAHGTIELDERMRGWLYSADEDIPPQKTRDRNASSSFDFLEVERFKMVAKRIW